MSEQNIDAMQVLTSEQAADQAARIIGEIARQADEPDQVDPHVDRTREVRTPGFSRMRTEWRPEDGPQVDAICKQAEGRIRALFPGAFQVMDELYAKVRTPVVDPHTGEIVRDLYGSPVWEKTSSGAYVEDYSKLTTAEREHFMYQVTINLVGWSQHAARLWLEAMLAKAVWEEAMAAGFVAPTGRMTVEERTQRGRAAAAEDRYHAIYRSALSRAADALIRNMELLGQRLKDGLGM